MARDLLEALHTILAIPGIQRVLSSGGDKTALEGAPGLRALVDTVRQQASALVVVAGGGITDRNVARIVQETGVSEVHLSGRSSRPSPMTHRTGIAMGASFGPPEYATSVADPAILRACRARLGHHV